MHALLPDTVQVRSHQDGSMGPVIGLEDVIFKNGTAVNTKTDTADLIFSLATGERWE